MCRGPCKAPLPAPPRPMLSPTEQTLSSFDRGHCDQEVELIYKRSGSCPVSLIQHRSDLRHFIFGAEIWRVITPIPPADPKTPPLPCPPPALGTQLAYRFSYCPLLSHPTTTCSGTGKFPGSLAEGHGHRLQWPVLSADLQPGPEHRRG